MRQRFTERARKVIFYAQEEAGKWNENVVSPEHLLLGLVREDDNMAARILIRMGVKLESVRKEVQARLQRGDGGQDKELQLSPAAKKVIDKAYEETGQLNDNYIGAEHLLLGLLRGEAGIALEVLAQLGVTSEGIYEHLQLIKAASKLEADKLAEELLSLDEAVKFLGTSKPTLYRLLGQDEIKGLKVGRQWRFRKVDLIAYMERSPVAFAAAPVEDLDVELAFFAQQLGLEASAFAIDAEDKTVKLSHKIMQLAIRVKASDIHLEVTAHDLLLRYRLDGVLQETRHLPLSVRESLIAQFKKMAEVDINEKRLPQDGRIPIRHEDKEYEMHLASIPSVYGEALTIQILLRGEALLGLERLDIALEDLSRIRECLHQPNGVFIAAGPTGSGKGTFLYSCLLELAGVEKKTMTVEDPVDHTLPHTTQVQVNKKLGLTFATALRALLRQDPDVILVGETRDLEVASLVTEASLTGHLILTSLPASDTPSALMRLVDMGVAPYLVTSMVLGVVAMRLCRRLCEHCKAPVDLSKEPTLSYVTDLAAEGGYNVPSGAVFYRGRGCEQCRGRGYSGRIPLYEVLTMNEALTVALLRRAPFEELLPLAVENGMRTLLADGVRKAVAGHTTVEEVLRVVNVSV